MTLLPTFLEVPFELAAGGEFVGHHLSARDISYALTAAWLAARMTPEQGTVEHFRIPDNRLRAALGRNRRDNADAETSRFIRLRNAVIRLDRDLPMPTVMFRGDIPIRSSLDDELTWVIHPDVVELFRPGGPCVLLPTMLLANARHSTTVELVLRLLAAHTRGPIGQGVVAWSVDRIGIRLNFPELAARFHLPHDTSPSALLNRYLRPAAADAFKAAGISIEIEERRAYTHRRPLGRAVDVLIYMVMTGPSALVAKIQAEQPTSWTSRSSSTPKRRGRPPKAKEPVLAVADTDNVVALRPRRRRPVAMDKMLGNGSVDSKEIDDTMRF